MDSLSFAPEQDNDYVPTAADVGLDFSPEQNQEVFSGGEQVTEDSPDYVPTAADVGLDPYSQINPATIPTRQEVGIGSFVKGITQGLMAPVQHFGQALSVIKDFTGLQFNGPRRGRQHRGIDILSKATISDDKTGSMDPVNTSSEGVVKAVTDFYPSKSGGKLKAVIVGAGDKDILYGELDPASVNVKVGDKVGKGQFIGNMGINPEGRAMLHMEMWKPDAWKNPNASYGKAEDVGALDPMLYLGMAGMPSAPKDVVRQVMGNQPLPSKMPLRQKASSLARWDLGDTGAEIFKGLVQTESSFNPKAVSPVGAMGLTQFMPETLQQELSDYNQKTGKNWTVKDFKTNPNIQLTMGVQYLKKQLQNYNGDYAAALAAYNGGGKGVEAIRKGENWPETIKYVQKVFSAAGIKDMSYDKARQMIMKPGTGPQFNPVQVAEEKANQTPHLMDNLKTAWDMSMATITGKPSKELLENPLYLDYLEITRDCFATWVGAFSAGGSYFMGKDMVPSGRIHKFADEMNNIWTTLLYGKSKGVSNFVNVTNLSAYLTQAAFFGSFAESMLPSAIGRTATAGELAAVRQEPGYLVTATLNRLAKINPGLVKSPIFKILTSPAVQNSLFWGGTVGVEEFNKTLSFGIQQGRKFDEVFPEAIAAGQRGTMIGFAMNLGLPFLGLLASKTWGGTGTLLNMAGSAIEKTPAFKQLAEKFPSFIELPQKMQQGLGSVYKAFMDKLPQEIKNKMSAQTARMVEEYRARNLQEQVALHETYKGKVNEVRMMDSQAIATQIEQNAAAIDQAYKKAQETHSQALSTLQKAQEQGQQIPVVQQYDDLWERTNQANQEYNRAMTALQNAEGMKKEQRKPLEMVVNNAFKTKEALNKEFRLFENNTLKDKDNLEVANFINQRKMAQKQYKVAQEDLVKKEANFKAYQPELDKLKALKVNDDLVMRQAELAKENKMGVKNTDAFGHAPGHPDYVGPEQQLQDIDYDAFYKANPDMDRQQITRLKDMLDNMSSNKIHNHELLPGMYIPELTQAAITQRSMLEGVHGSPTRVKGMIDSVLEQKERELTSMIDGGIEADAPEMIKVIKDVSDLKRHSADLKNVKTLVQARGYAENEIDRMTEQILADSSVATTVAGQMAHIPVLSIPTKNLMPSKGMIIPGVRQVAESLQDTLDELVLSHYAQLKGVAPSYFEAKAAQELATIQGGGSALKLTSTGAVKIDRESADKFTQTVFDVTRGNVNLFNATADFVRAFSKLNTKFDKSIAGVRNAGGIGERLAQNMADVQLSSEGVGLVLEKNFRAYWNDLWKSNMKSQSGRYTATNHAEVMDSFINALEDKTAMKAFVEKYPEMVQPLVTMKNIQGLLEFYKATDPQTRPQMLSYYMHHAWPRIREYFDRRPDDLNIVDMGRTLESISTGTAKFDNEYTKLVAQNSKVFTEANKNTSWKLLVYGPENTIKWEAKDRWALMHPGEAFEGTSAQMNEVADVTRAMLLGEAEKDPAKIIVNTLRGHVYSMATHNFLQNLSDVRTAEGIELVKVIGKPGSKETEKYLSDLVLAEAGGMTSKKTLKPYVKLSTVTGFHIGGEVKVNGEYVKVSQLEVHPDVAKVLTDRFITTKANDVWKTARIISGLARGWTLMGSHIPFFSNTYTSPLLISGMDSWTASGFYKAGELLHNTPELMIDAVQNGVSLNSSIYKEIGEDVRAVLDKQAPLFGSDIVPANPTMAKAQDIFLKVAGVPVRLDDIIQAQLLFKAITEGQTGSWMHITNNIFHSAEGQHLVDTYGLAAATPMIKKMAAERVNTAMGSFSKYWFGSTWRNSVYTALQTPMFTSSILDIFRSAMDPMLTKAGVRSRFAHALDPTIYKAQQQAFLKFATAGIAGVLIGTNMANYIINGHSSFENAPGKEMHVKIGSTPDGDMYVRPNMGGMFSPILNMLPRYNVKGKEVVWTPAMFNRVLIGRLHTCIQAAMEIQANKTGGGEQITGGVSPLKDAADILKYLAFHATPSDVSGGRMGDVFEPGVIPQKNYSWMGIYTSRVNEPERKRAALNRNITYYRDKLKAKVRDNLSQAIAAQAKGDEVSYDKYYQKAVELAFQTGQSVDDKKTRAMIEQSTGRSNFFLTKDMFKGIYMRLSQPAAYNLKGTNRMAKQNYLESNQANLEDVVSSQDIINENLGGI